MDTLSFKHHYASLNPAQKQAVDAIEGTVMVIAGPGTGKTQVLTLRIANILLKTQAEPDNILALTFTESGVAAMRRRLISLIGPTAYAVNLFTFHGLANYLIQSDPSAFPDFVGSRPITDLEQVEIIETLITNNRFDSIKPLGDPLFYVKPALSAINELKKENISPDILEKALNKDEEHVMASPDLYHEKGRYQGKMKSAYQEHLKQITKNRELLILYRMYQDQLKSQKLYDFQDMLLVVINKLEQDEDFRIGLEERFQYVLVDEHQDTNRSQNRIIELLTSYFDDPNLFAVGDEKQAIYRFQGASLSNFLYFKTKYPKAQVISLKHNYRSTQVILDAAHGLIGHNQIEENLNLPLRLPLFAANLNSSQINLVNTPDSSSQYHYIANDIKKVIDDGGRPQDIAVLARTNADLSPVIDVFSKAGIPFALGSKQNVLEDDLILSFINLLRLVDSLDSDEYLIKAMYLSVFSIHPRDIIALVKIAQDNKTSIFNILDHFDDHRKDLILPDKISSLYEKLIRWHNFSRTNPLDQIFVTLLKESGIIDHLLSLPSFVDSLDKMTALYRQVKLKLDREPRFSLAQFLNFLSLIETHHLSLQAKITSSKTNAVQIMTAHGSKGLEFDRVYIVNCSDKRWGNVQNRGARFKLPYDLLNITITDSLKEDAVADERRLFYVSLTRAKNHITITYPKVGDEGDELLASRFMAELPESLVATPDLQTFERWYGDNKTGLVFATPSFSSSFDRETLESLVVDLFNQKGLSVTALNNYLKCPWHFFFKNLVRLPEAKTVPLILGSAVHATINHYLISRHKKVSLSDLIQFTSDYFAKEPLSDHDRDKLVEESQLIFTGFFPKLSEFAPTVRSELKIDGVGLEPDIRLTGKIDAIEPLGNSRDVRVYDFKTGDPKKYSRNYIEGKTKNSDGGYKRQLVFYQLLLDRFQKGRYHMVEGILSFVKPMPNGAIKSERFVITKQETNDLENLITTVAAEIRSLSFWDKTCDDKQCQYCAIRRLMTA